MAAIYHRKDSQKLWIVCYPQTGTRPERAITKTADWAEAERIREKVDLLVELERLKDRPVPETILARFTGLPCVTKAESSPEPALKNEDVQNFLPALRALITRSAA